MHLKRSCPPATATRLLALGRIEISASRNGLRITAESALAIVAAVVVVALVL
jgi:hypothetical protein